MGIAGSRMKGRWTLGWAAALALGAGGVSPAFADVHKDTETGFSINVPRDWRKIPVAGEEKYIVAKYIADRPYLDKKEGYSHTPEMKVILFPAGQKKGAKVTQTDEGIVLRFSDKYKDYKAFLKDNSYGGFYISKEEETTVGGVTATCYEVKFEKLTVPRRLVAWVFHAEDADYAVSFEVLEDYWTKASPEYVQCLKSFKLVPRTKGLASTTGEEVVLEDLRKLTPEERAKRRATKFEAALEKEVAGLPKGWTLKRSKNYVALSHVDDKYTTAVLDLAEGVRAWLEKRFGSLGTGVPGPVMLRICADDAEERAYTDTSGRSWLFSEKPEICMCKDSSAGKQSFEFQRVSRGVMQYWMRDKNPGLASALPGWIDSGFDQFVMTGVLKGKNVEFRPDEWEMTRLRESGRAGKIAGAKTMMTATWEEFSKTENAMAQAGALCRFLLDGPGAKGKTKDVFTDYLKNLAAFVRERDEAETADDGADAAGDTPKTEEEEDEQYKARQQEWKNREREVLDEVLKRTFGSWDDGDWKSFEQAYLRFVG